MIIGVILAGIGALLLVQEQDFLKVAVRSQGVVVDYKMGRKKKNGRRSSSLFPVVTYTTRENHEIKFVSSFGSTPAKYKIGEKVTVLYDPRDPNEAQIEGYMEQWFAPTVLMGMSFIFLAIGAGVLQFGFKNHKMNHSEIIVNKP